MSRSKVAFIVALLFLSLQNATAQENSAPPAIEQQAPAEQIPPPPEAIPDPTPAAPPPAPPSASSKPTGRKPLPSARARAVRRAPPTRSAWSMGAVYMMWSERISIAKSGAIADGFANYGGIGFAIEKTWTTGSWVYAATGVMAVGKASSDGFVGVPYTDGVDRPWTALHLSGTAGYRLNPVFSVGPGLLVRSRTAQWESADPLLEITPDKQSPVAPQLVLRWVLGNKIALTQTYAPIDMNGNTLWQWDGQWIF